MSGFWSLKIGKSKQDNGKSAKRDGNGKDSSEIVRVLMDRVITDAEQLVDSIKAKALKEAEAEITRLIEQAGLGELDTATTTSEIQETGGNNSADVPVDAVAEPETTASVEPSANEATITAPESPADTPEEERMDIDASTTPEPVTDEAGEEEIGPALVEESSPDKTELETEDTIEASEDPVPAEMVVDKHTMYSEEVELAVSTPVDPAALSRLYNNLQMTPEIKIMYTRGSWDKGTVLTIDLEKPLPLLEIISSVPEIEVTILETQKNDTTIKPSGVLLGNGKKNIKRIDMLLKSK